MKSTTKRFFALLLIISGFLLTLYFFAGGKNEGNTLPVNNEAAWITYNDREFNFKISYPPNLEKTIQTNNEEFGFGKLIKNISFHTKGPGNVGVKIYTDLTFDNLVGFLNYKNEQKEMIKYEVETELVIGNLPAVVFHTVTISPGGQKEEFLNEKKLVLIKDSHLFEIWTRFDDAESHKNVWKSFGFE